MEFDNENSRCVSAGPKPDARVCVTLRGEEVEIELKGRSMDLVKMAATALMESIKKGVKPGCWPGVLDQIAGLIFGECTDCTPGEGYGWLTLPQIFDDHIKPLGIPAYRGAMIGHIRQQFIVPVGGRVELDADAGTFRMLEPVFRT